MQTSNVDVFDPEGSSPVNVVKITTTGRAVQLLEALLYKTGGSGCDSRYGPWNFSRSCPFCPWSTQLPTEMNTKEVPWG